LKVKKYSIFEEKFRSATRGTNPPGGQIDSRKFASCSKFWRR